MMSTMTRNYYSDLYNDMDRYRFQHAQYGHYEDRAVPSFISYGDGRTMRSTQSVRPDRSAQDVDQDQPINNTTRRRIAVACSRCRKRKIKCSGDQGNGLGCHNCRVAGVDSCNFYRVGASELALLGHPAGSISNTYLPPAHMGIQHQYHYPQAHQQLSIITRGLPISPYYSAEAQPYDAEAQAESYVVSPATPMAPQEVYGYSLHDSSRTWPNSNSRYISYYPRCGEQDSGNTYAYASSYGRRPGAGDASSTLSTSSLQTSLPTPSVDGRVLPPPNSAGRPQYNASPYEMMHMKANASSSSLNAAATVASVAKVSSGWGTVPATANARSDSTGSSRPSAMAAPMLHKPRAASSTTSDNSTLRYISSSTSPNISPMTTDTVNQMNGESGVMSTHGQAVPITHAEHPIYTLPDASASEARLSHTGPSGGCMYSFSIAKRQQSHGELPTSGDRLINGTTYVPLPPPAEQTNIHCFRRESSNSRHNSLEQSNAMPAVAQDS